MKSKLRHKRVRMIEPKKLILDLGEERKEVLKLMKNIQTRYFIERDINKAEYDEQSGIYNERLAEIEDEKLTLKKKLFKERQI